MHSISVSAWCCNKNTLFKHFLYSFLVLVFIKFVISCMCVSKMKGGLMFKCIHSVLIVQSLTWLTAVVFLLDNCWIIIALFAHLLYLHSRSAMCAIAVCCPHFSFIINSVILFSSKCLSPSCLYEHTCLHACQALSVYVWHVYSQLCFANLLYSLLFFIKVNVQIFTAFYMYIHNMRASSGVSQST